MLWRLSKTAYTKSSNLIYPDSHLPRNIEFLLFNQIRSCLQYSISSVETPERTRNNRRMVITMQIEIDHRSTRRTEKRANILLHNLQMQISSLLLCYSWLYLLLLHICLSRVLVASAILRAWNLWESGKRDESRRCTVSFSFCFIFPSGCANKNGVCRVLRGETKLRMNDTCLHAGSLPLPLLRRRLSTAFSEKRDTFSSFPRGSRLVSSSSDFLLSKYRSHFHVESSLFHFPTFARLRLEE